MHMFGFLEILFVVLSGSGGNELLDFLPTDAYWQRKGVPVTVDAMVDQLRTEKPKGIPELVRDLGAPDYATREAASRQLATMGAAARPALEQAAESEDPEVRERARALLGKLAEGGVQAKAVRRLMAIRTLGELGKPEALPVLRPLLESRELFVADYARRAIAAIGGEALPPAELDRAALAEDLATLPPKCGLVAQAAVPRGGVPIRKALDDAAGMLPPGMDAAQIMARLTDGILQVAERVGNVRLDRLTLGLAEAVDDDTGFVVFVARGLYDAAAVKAALREAGASVRTVEGVDVLAVEREFRIIPFSNERFVLIGGPREAMVPIADVVAALQRPPKAHRQDETMARLIEDVDLTQPLWGVAKVTPSYRQVPLFAPFETATLATRRDEEGRLVGTLVGRGKNPEAVKGAAATLQAGVKEGIAEMKQQAERMPPLKPMVEFLESIQVRQEGVTLTVTGKLQGTFALPMMPLFLFTARMGAMAPPPPPPAAIQEAPAAPAPRR